jgi:hypothetical protein
MKPLAPVPAACISLLLLANTSLAQPQHEAITQYKAFVAAAGAGKIDDARKLVEPVPNDAERLLQAGLRLFVAYVQLKTELTSQFGLPGPNDEDEFGERAIAPALMANLLADVRHENMAVVHSRDPDTRAKITMMVMVRRNGKWLVSADMLTDQELDELESKPGRTFKTPPADERKQFIEYAESTARTIETVLTRLKKKEFKTRTEVLKAVSGLMPKADGEIDIDEC